ncbi:MAG: wax ester/triacylglycerol synthase family O-acyltransferase [Pseudomonadales bacterium]|nr:wax ester/triacylglycerol synthase family O-acyltransferase [Pseudomonadales bacterium]
MSDQKSLSPGDAFFLLIESDNTPSQIGVLVRMKLPKGKDKTFILEMIEGFRKYQPTEEPYNLKLAKRSLTSPLYSWEKAENVDIDYHLRHSALPQPGGEREMAVLISRLHSIPLDHNRPMWELHVIEGLEDDCFAIYAKMHHALIDGVAGSRLMAHWAEQTEPNVESEFIPFWAKPLPKKSGALSALAKKTSTENQSLLSQFVGAFKSASIVLQAVWKSVLGQRSKNDTGLIAPYSAPDSILNAPIGPQRRVSTVEFKTDRLKAIGKKHGGTLNDVVMAVCGGALRSYLSDLGELPESSLIAQVPVSFRPKDEVGGGNAIGALLASLGTDEEDTVTRFNKVIASMSAGKGLLSEMNANQITGYSALMTLPFVIGQMTKIGNRRRNPMYNVVISNVPGPRETRYLNGAEVFSVHPVSFVMQGQALNITLYTYADKITFVFTACRESLPSVQHLVGHTIDALDDLENALGIK